MVNVKQIRLKVIPARVANDFIKKHHYSGKVVNNSNLHFGAFLDDRLHGVMSFGNSLDKRKMIGLVKGTLWNEFLELNRMAFDDYLPKNSESRCIGIALKLIKKNYPHIKWVVSFADGTQCGDGTIYRASGFVLVSIKSNTQIMEFPDGRLIARKTLDNKNNSGQINGRYGSSVAKEIGAKYLSGNQLKYVYFLQPNEKQNLTVPILPFSKIDEMGAGMYKGQKRKLCDGSSERERSASSGKVAV